MSFCSKCGAEVTENSAFCQACGFQIQPITPLAETQASSTVGNPPSIERTQVSVGGKRLSIVLLLTILPGLIGIWGIGHFYLGRITRGIVILLMGLFINLIAAAVSLVTFGVGLPIWILMLIGWVLQSLDAYKIAKPSTADMRPNNKSVGIAAFLALWFGIFGFWGVGHFYAGKTVRGIVLLAISLMAMLTVAAISFLVGFAPLVINFLSVFMPDLSSGQLDNTFDTFLSSLGIGLIIIVVYVILWGIVYIWQCIDACRAVQKWNNILTETRSKPW